VYCIISKVKNQDLFAIFFIFFLRFG
jgi:hypothetical protein